jgi:hypothetical protein
MKKVAAMRGQSVSLAGLLLGTDGVGVRACVGRDGVLNSCSLAPLRLNALSHNQSPLQNTKFWGECKRKLR